MQKINWDMMTQFVFPEQLGVVEEVVSVEIKPIWQQIETEDSVRLVGIYHIAAIARFNPDELPESSDGTFIEELEFEGNNGYFEYAMPLEIDLPRDKVAYDCAPEVCINDVAYFIYDGSNCTFKWDVDCQFDEAVEGGLFQYEQPAPIEFQEPPLPEKPVLQETAPISEAIPQVPVFEQQEPLIEVAPSYEDFQTEEESPFTEEIHFGGPDGVFPEQPELSKEQLTSPETVPEGQPLEESPNFEESPSYDVSEGTVIEDIEENKIEEPVLEQNEKEKVVEARNQYFPTDTDDFYNELTESYTILNVSNKIYRD
ncbi:hypothetical protein QMK38_01585 [Lysinibacillus fusiformis]|nr:hypothetical protein [Lysinibacillus fusiformis]